MSSKEFNELLDLMSENNLTQHGADTLYGEIVDREIERGQLKQRLQQKENIIKEVREYIEKEREKMKNHQYAVGIRRLNKIEGILDKENKQ